jgi:hypothetical protein
MKSIVRPVHSLLLGSALLVSACSSFPSSSPDSQTGPSNAAVPAGPNEGKPARALAREQDGRLSTCMHDHSCDRAHFTRALLLLSENQELAAKHFQEVVAISPKSPLAALSLSWLRLLKDRSSERRQEALFGQTTQWLIQDHLSREQLIKDALTHRDRKLEELSSQLEALKQIDMEMAEKPHPMKPKPKAGQGIDSPN